MDNLKVFIPQAVVNATRSVLSTGKFLPILEGVLAVLKDDGVTGVRVFFEPPVEAVWVNPAYQIEAASYDGARAVQSPLTATYYVFSAEDIVAGNYDNPTIYNNPAE